MSSSPLNTPIITNGVISDERLAQLLALQAEYPELDYKEDADLKDSGSTIELAKDIGAMQVRGGYIIIGADNSGKPTGALDGRDLRAFDEASLSQKMLRFLPEPIHLRSRVADYGGHRLVIIFVGPHPEGCAFFKANGIYKSNVGGRDTVAFKEGEVFWRDGSRSTRMTQAGHREVVARQVAAEKDRWFEEQREIRRQEREHREAASAAQQPLGTVSLDMSPSELSIAALEMARGNDVIGLRYLASEASARSRRFIDDGEVEDDLGALLDRIVCLAATFLEYEQWPWFDRMVGLLRGIYSMPLADGDAQRFGYNLRISPEEPAPRVWLQLMTRIYALGALAVRRQTWNAVRTLTLQLPDGLMDYETNWLRHAITMISRAEHLQGEQEGRQIELSLLSLAQAQIARLSCLRPDGLQPDDEQILTSLVQFDALSNLVAVADSPDHHFGKTFYPNFARFHDYRAQPVVKRLIGDQKMRAELGVEDDVRLATALAAVGEIASKEGLRYFGFHGWEQPINDFVAANLPAQS